MKINYSRGDPTDISARKEALNTTSTQHTLYNDPAQHIRIAILSPITKLQLLSAYSSIQDHNWNIHRCVYNVSDTNID